MKRIGGPWRGILRRIHADDRGFTLVEVVFAITIMFVVLLALGYTATIGFSYESLARENTLDPVHTVEVPRVGPRFDDGANLPLLLDEFADDRAANEACRPRDGHGTDHAIAFW